MTQKKLISKTDEYAASGQRHLAALATYRKVVLGVKDLPDFFRDITIATSGLISLNVLVRYGLATITATGTQESEAASQ